MLASALRRERRVLEELVGAAVVRAAARDHACVLERRWTEDDPWRSGREEVWQALADHGAREAVVEAEMLDPTACIAHPRHPFVVVPDVVAVDLAHYQAHLCQTVCWAPSEEASIEGGDHVIIILGRREQRIRAHPTAVGGATHRSEREER